MIPSKPIYRVHQISNLNLFLYYKGNDYLGHIKYIDGVWSMNITLKMYIYRGIITNIK